MPLFAVQDVFESRVILDGSQTHRYASSTWIPFESRVILDGSQTERLFHTTFEPV